MSWILATFGLLALALGLAGYLRRRSTGEGQTGPILTLIVGADLVVLALGAALF